MDDRRKQFVRIMSQAAGLLEQAKFAASLAPQKRLVDDVDVLVVRARELVEDVEPWFFGKDSRGRMMSEAGQVVEVDDE